MYLSFPSGARGHHTAAVVFGDEAGDVGLIQDLLKDMKDPETMKQVEELMKVRHLSFVSIFWCVTMKTECGVMARIASNILHQKLKGFEKKMAVYDTSDFCFVFVVYS